MSYKLTEVQLKYHQAQGHIDNTPREWFQKILEIPREVTSWEKEGEAIDELPQGEEKNLSKRRMQCAAAAHKVLWFQGHVFPNYKSIGAAIDAAQATPKTADQPVI